jgi:hypothetical protein
VKERPRPRGRGAAPPKWTIRLHEGHFSLEENSSLSRFAVGSLEARLSAASVPEPSTAARLLRYTGATIESDQDLNRFGPIIEEALGLEPGKDWSPDLGVYELKTTTGQGDAPSTCLFGIAPHWVVNKREIANRYGERGTLLIERVMVKSANPKQRLQLFIQDGSVSVVADSKTLMTWSLSDLQERLEKKMAHFVKLQGEKRGKQIFVTQGALFSAVKPGVFSKRIKGRGIYLRLQIPQRAWKSHQEFFASTTALDEIYDRKLTLRPD